MDFSTLFLDGGYRSGSESEVPVFDPAGSEARVPKATKASCIPAHRSGKTNIVLYEGSFTDANFTNLVYVPSL
jgi:hypothetical protein